MTPNEYQIAAMRTANPKPAYNLHMHQSLQLLLNGALGLSGESGEVTDHVKKILFQGHEYNPETIMLELGDVCWYLAITAHALGYSLEHVMQANIDKLKARYPDGFDSVRSTNRDGE